VRIGTKSVSYRDMLRVPLIGGPDDWDFSWKGRTMTDKQRPTGFSDAELDSVTGGTAGSAGTTAAPVAPTSSGDHVNTKRPAKVTIPDLK
jgi:hypothetical protein